MYGLGHGDVQVNHLLKRDAKLRHVHFRLIHDLDDVVADARAVHAVRQVVHVELNALRHVTLRIPASKLAAATVKAVLSRSSARRLLKPKCHVDRFDQVDLQRLRGENIDVARVSLGELDAQRSEFVDVHTSWIAGARTGLVQEPNRAVDGSPPRGAEPAVADRGDLVRAPTGVGHAVNIDERGAAERDVGSVDRQTVPRIHYHGDERGGGHKHRCGDHFLSSGAILHTQTPNNAVTV